MPTSERLTLTPRESTKITGFGISHTYRMLREGTLPAIKVGKKYVIPRAALSRFLETCGGYFERGQHDAARPSALLTQRPVPAVSSLTN